MIIPGIPIPTEHDLITSIVDRHIESKLEIVDTSDAACLDHASETGSGSRPKKAISLVRVDIDTHMGRRHHPRISGLPGPTPAGASNSWDQDHAEDVTTTSPM